MSEQQIQRRLKKRRVHGFEDAIILFVWFYRLDERFTCAIGAEAVRQQFAGVRSPLTEIVVHINYGNIRRTSALLKARQSRGNLQRIFENCLSVGKFEMIDDIHQKQYGWDLWRTISFPIRQIKRSSRLARVFMPPKDQSQFW